MTFNNEKFDLKTSAADVKQSFQIVCRKKIIPFVEPDEQLKAIIHMPQSYDQTNIKRQEPY